MAAALPDNSPRYAIVTGAESGIGRAISLALAELGWAVGAVDINGDAASTTVTELASTSGLSFACEADVAEEQDWRRLLDEARRRWPRLDLLVNNAGVLVGGELAATTGAAMQRLIDVNLTGTLLGCQAAAPWLMESASRQRPVDRRSPRAGIINTASIFANVAPPGFAAYNASKAGVVALSRSLRGELAPHGLNVTVTLPGAVGTGLFGAAEYAGPAFEQAASRFAARAALSPEAVAEQTLRAASAGRGVVVIGARAKRFAWLGRVAPTLADWLVARRARDELGLSESTKPITTEPIATNTESPSPEYVSADRHAAS